MILYSVEPGIVHDCDIMTCLHNMNKYHKPFLAPDQDGADAQLQEISSSGSGHYCAST